MIPYQLRIFKHTVYGKDMPHEYMLYSAAYLAPLAFSSIKRFLCFLLPSLFHDGFATGLIVLLLLMVVMTLTTVL